MNTSAGPKKCLHCHKSVEADQYIMCKDCWWARDARNPNRMTAGERYAVDNDIVPAAFYRVSHERSDALKTMVDNIPHHCAMGHKGCTSDHTFADYDVVGDRKVVVDQNGGLLMQDELEQKYFKAVEDIRRSFCCSLDEAVARCYTSETSSEPFKKWLFTLAGDKSTF